MLMTKKQIVYRHGILQIFISGSYLSPYYTLYILTVRAQLYWRLIYYVP